MSPIEQMAERLRGIFLPATLLAITPPWARDRDPHVRLARTLLQSGFILREPDKHEARD